MTANGRICPKIDRNVGEKGGTPSSVLSNTWENPKLLERTIEKRLLDVDNKRKGIYEKVRGTYKAISYYLTYYLVTDHVVSRR